MDIFETLRVDHAQTRGLLDDIIELTIDEPTESGKSLDMKLLPEINAESFRALKQALVMHDRAEEAVFYEALDILGHSRELSETKTEEHHLIESYVEELENLSLGDPLWKVTLGLLKNQLELHVAEEETTVFNLMSSFIDDETSDKMARDFLRIKSGDAHVPVSQQKIRNIPHSRLT
jgi:hypothetical protein